MNADDIKALDFQNATVTLWFFKQPQKGKDGRPKYTGRWLEIDNEISEKLKESPSITCDNVDDVSNFSLLGSTNDGKSLSIQADETNADLIQGQTAGELPDKKISKVKEVLNSKFYVAKFIVGDSIILAFKKLDSTWSTKKIKLVHFRCIQRSNSDPCPRKHISASEKLRFSYCKRSCHYR
jgi:hypothetical protein